MLRLGIDLGGTKIELCGLVAGKVVHRERVATPADDYRAIIEALAGVVERADLALGERGSVGICTPGAISSKTGRIKNSNTLVLNGEALDRDLAKRLGRDVRMENDANCFALSEAIDGAGVGELVVFGVILGTGVGGGIVIGGRCVVGANAIAGEWGHIPLPYLADEERPAPRCYCGRDGCVETYLSGSGLRAEYARRGGPPMAASEIARAASHGDGVAIEALASYCDRLARGLSIVINVVDPHVIVLGGGLSLIDALYRGVPLRLPRYVFSDEIATRIVPAVHGDASGVLGAAYLWPA